MSHPFTLNGDFAALKPTGVARYADRVVRAIDTLLDENHPAFAGLDLTLIVKPDAPRVPDLSVIRIVEAAEPKPRLPQAWVQAVLPAKTRGGLVSLCNFGPLAVRKQILCIHDVHPLQSPQSYSRGFQTYSRVMLPLLGRHVAAVTTVSDFSKDQLTHFGVAPADKITVTFNGHEHVFDTPAAPLPDSSRPYVMGIGRDLVYKNTGLYFEIAPQLEAAGIDVVLAGAFDPDRYLPPGGALPTNVRLAGRVDDATLFALMRGARAFLFPSRVEGFGLPAVEAMAADCPLLVSSSPCLPEVCADAAIVVDPDDVDGWAAAAIRIATDKTVRARLTAAGQERRKAFSWRRIALQYAAAMRSISGLSPVSA